MIWDVIVIGAGPASAAFARKAAEGGVNILIIDGQTEKKESHAEGYWPLMHRSCLQALILCFQRRCWQTHRFLPWKPWIYAPDR